MTEQSRGTKRTVSLHRVILAVCTLLVLMIFLITAVSLAGTARRRRDAEQSRAAAQTSLTAPPPVTTSATTTTERYPSAASRTTNTVTIAEDNDCLRCRNAALIEVTPAGNRLIAERNADKPIYPASLTKLMTLNTFLEMYGSGQLDQPVQMSEAALTEAHAKLAACTGLQAGEVCTVRDLLHGLMLPSGADAAYMLAQIAAGSEEKFVAEMNRLAAEMGLTDTHFVNCTGLHDDRHISTAQDIARLLCYVRRNPVCAGLMQTPSYTTPSTAEHPQGVSLLSTVFSRMSGTELLGRGYRVVVRGGKTGFTNEAGQCLATFADDGGGREFICVVAGCDGAEPMDAVYDTLTLYQLTERPLSGIDRYLPDDLIEETEFSGSSMP